jgi:hypothetical protein
LVFVVSVVSKVRNRKAYAEFVASTRRLAPPLVSAARPLAAVVVGMELAAVLLVALPPTVLAGFGVAAALLVAFSGAILLALRRGERAPCRCFGTSEQPLGYTQVVRNVALIAVTVLGALGGLATTAAPALPGVVIAVATGGILALLAIMADDIAALFRGA